MYLPAGKFKLAWDIATLLLFRVCVVLVAGASSYHVRRHVWLKMLTLKIIIKYIRKLAELINCKHRPYELKLKGNTKFWEYRRGPLRMTLTVDPRFLRKYSLPSLNDWAYYWVYFIVSSWQISKKSKGSDEKWSRDHPRGRDLWPALTRRSGPAELSFCAHQTQNIKLYLCAKFQKIPRGPLGMTLTFDLVYLHN